MTPHATHVIPDRRCPACRWQAMSPQEQAMHRSRAQAQWRSRYPERAARRDAILAGLPVEPCGRCGGEAVPFITDYEQAMVVWRCRGCATAEKAERGSSRQPEVDTAPSSTSITAVADIAARTACGPWRPRSSGASRSRRLPGRRQRIAEVA